MDFEKERQKKIKRFLKKSGAIKYFSKNEIKEKLIDYVSKVKNNFCLLVFPDDFLNDADFMLKLYKCNPKTLFWFKPNEILAPDVNFMIEYVKLIKEQNDIYSKYPDLILNNYPIIMENRTFIEKLAKQFPDMDIVYLIKNCINKPTISEHIKNENNEKIKHVLESLPVQLLQEQAKRFGYKTLIQLPKDMKNIELFVSAGIEKDGFESLEILQPEQILKNKALIVKAYKKDGIDKLYNYINNSLNPNRTFYYMCHGEPHSYSKYVQEYRDLQLTLMKDPTINEIFKIEKEFFEKKNQVVQHMLKKDNQQSSFENSMMK